IWSTQVAFIPHLISLQLVSVSSFHQCDKRYDAAERERGKIDGRRRKVMWRKWSA
ncbi:hypothetical protein AMELA_G00059290, partial [Ameiurus melas]